MTREQLIDYLESVLSPSGRAVTVADFNLIPDILSALRGPQPDPDTGLVPCGCGGKAEIRKWEWANDAYIAGCTVCDANVDFPYDIDETDKIISDWNRAMGRRTEKMNRLTFTKEFKKHEEIGRILCLKPEKLIEWEEKLSQYEDIGEPKELIKRPSLDENGLAQCGCGGNARIKHDRFVFIKVHRRKCWRDCPIRNRHC